VTTLIRAFDHELPCYFERLFTYSVGLLRARRERSHRRCAAEQRDELASVQLIELHSEPTARAGLQDIELARSSQRVSERLCPPRFALDLALQVPRQGVTSRCRLDQERDPVRLGAAGPWTRPCAERDAITDFWLIAWFNARAMEEHHAAVIRHDTTVAVLLIKQFDCTDHCFTSFVELKKNESHFAIALLGIGSGRGFSKTHRPG
jgi:hypothetical protein